MLAGGRRAIDTTSINGNMNMILSSKELQKALDKCWSIQDLEKLFKVSGMTIHNWRAKRGLPAIVIAGRSRPALRFVPSEVWEWGRTNDVPMHKFEKRT